MNSKEEIKKDTKANFNFKLVKVIIPWYKKLFYWLIRKEPISNKGLFTIEEPLNRVVKTNENLCKCLKDFNCLCSKEYGCKHCTN